MVHKEMTCVAMQTNDRDWMLWVVVMLLDACLLILPRLPPRSVLVRDGVAVRYIPAGWCAWSDSVNRGPSAKTHPSGEHRWR